MSSDKPRLIVVDDEPDMLEFIQRALRQSYQVTSCRTGKEVLARLETATFDVLITDQQMPEINGIELLRKVAVLAPNMVKVLMSGFTTVAEMHQLARDCGVHGVVLKPIDSQKLQEAIQRAYAVQAGASFEAPE